MSEIPTRMPREGEPTRTINLGEAINIALQWYDQQILRGATKDRRYYRLHREELLAKKRAAYQANREIFLARTNAYYHRVRSKAARAEAL